MYSRIMAEIGVHVEQIIEAVLDGEPHRRDGRRAQAQLARPVDHVDVRQRSRSSSAIRPSRRVSCRR